MVLAIYTFYGVDTLKYSETCVFASVIYSFYIALSYIYLVLVTFNGLNLTSNAEKFILICTVSFLEALGTQLLMNIQNQSTSLIVKLGGEFILYSMFISLLLAYNQLL